MKDLDLLITRRGFRYTQVFKNDKWYIYKQQDQNGNNLAYEVFYRKENIRFDCVSFPGDEAFGLWAWSCTTLDRALKRLQ